MDEQIQQKLSSIGVEAAQGLLEWTKAANDFAVEQAPMLAQEIVAWGITRGLVLVVVNVLFMAILVAFIAWLYRISFVFWKTRDELDPHIHVVVLSIGWVFVSVFGSILFCTCFGEMCEGVLNASYSYTAPRLYIIETLSKMLSGDTK